MSSWIGRTSSRRRQICMIWSYFSTHIITISILTSIYPSHNCSKQSFQWRRKSAATSEFSAIPLWLSCVTTTAVWTTRSWPTSCATTRIFRTPTRTSTSSRSRRGTARASPYTRRSLTMFFLSIRRSRRRTRRRCSSSWRTRSANSTSALSSKNSSSLLTSSSKHLFFIRNSQSRLCQLDVALMKRCVKWKPSSVTSDILYTLMLIKPLSKARKASRRF